MSAGKYSVVGYTPYSRMVFSTHRTITEARRVAAAHRARIRERAKHDSAFKRQQYRIDVEQGADSADRTTRSTRAGRFSGVLRGSEFTDRGYSERDWHVFRHGHYLGRVTEERTAGQGTTHHARIGKSFHIARSFKSRQAAVRWLATQHGRR